MCITEMIHFPYNFLKSWGGNAKTIVKRIKIMKKTQNYSKNNVIATSTAIGIGVRVSDSRSESWDPTGLSSPSSFLGRPRQVLFVRASSIAKCLFRQ